jgi:NADH:ubiquinone oxidoreductase subunit 5 (subunit L)/multisubunit Na+/H+ antiporter MnhA subunit
MLGLAKRIPSLAFIGFAAGLLHVLNHSIFKGLLFLGAGAGSCAVTLPHPGQQRLEHSIPASLQIVAAIGEVEAFVAQRKIHHRLAAHGDRQRESRASPVW